MQRDSLKKVNCNLKAWRRDSSKQYLSNMHSPRGFEAVIAHWFRLLLQQVPQLIFLDTLFPNTSNNSKLLVQAQSEEKIRNRASNIRFRTQINGHIDAKTSISNQKFLTGLMKSSMSNRALALKRRRLRGTVYPRMGLVKALPSPLKLNGNDQNLKLPTLGFLFNLVLSFACPVLT